MLVNSDRFGSLEVDAEDAICFPQGVIGFPNDDTFVLLRPREDSRIAWIQSTRTPELALPVVSLHMTAIDAPLDAIAKAVTEMNIAENIDDCAVLLVVTATPNNRPTVNLLAPIIVNSATRTGVQVLLDVDPRALQTPLCLRPEEEANATMETTTTTTSSETNTTMNTAAATTTPLYDSAE
jgi:flagellar assembly factor FliW